MISVVVATSLCLSGCGGSISKEDFASNFAKSTGSQSSLSEEQAIWIGENIDTEAGEEQSTELDGQLSESTTIPKELIAPVAKAGPRCAGAGDVLREQLETQDITAEQVDCIVEAINNDEELNQQVWDALAASYGGDQSKAAALKETIAKTATSCVVG